MRSMEKRKILAYFGHHKCASTLMLRIINAVCGSLGLKHAHFGSPKRWGYEDGFTLDKAVDERKLDFVSYTDADLKYIGDLARFRAVHLIRDPRDIAISAYFSHRNSHSTDGWPELAAFRKVLQELPKNEGVFENIKFTAELPTDGWAIKLFDTMKEWNYGLENIMEVRFEDLIRDPYQNFLDMFGFLGLIEFSDPSMRSLLSFSIRSRHPRWFPALPPPSIMPAWALLTIVYQNRFSKLAGERKLGEEDEFSHYRKGTAGDWKNHFNESHKIFFKEHYNDLLVKLGYESDANW